MNKVFWVLVLHGALSIMGKKARGQSQKKKEKRKKIKKEKEKEKRKSGGSWANK